MNHHAEWIIQYHGNLKRALQGTRARANIINEKYAIVRAYENEIPYLRNRIEIRHMEKATQIHELEPDIDPSQVTWREKDGKDTRIGWISHTGILPKCEVIIAKLRKNKIYTTDAIRALFYIINQAPKEQMPLIIYFPFEICNKVNILVQEIIKDIAFGGEITVVTSLEDLLYSLNPPTMIEGFRTLDMAYEFALEDSVIDIFVKYNNFDYEVIIQQPKNANLYPLVFPYLGIRGTVNEVRQLVGEYLGKMYTGSLAHILGSEPLNIVPSDFKATSILKTPTSFRGKGTLVGIIDTGIDYTNPVFMNDKQETRILRIWDQTIGNNSPYGYGTIYNQETINEALRSPDPFTVVPHKDEVGSGTILTGIATGYGKYQQGVYQGAAPEAEIVVVKLVPANPDMQSIYYSQYNALAFSALDIARAVQYLATLANQYQKPISICLPLGTNSGPHDGNSILDAIIMIYAENPGVCMVLPAGEEANKGHHASGNLEVGKEKVITLTIPEGQGGFMIEIWSAFGDRFEASLTQPKVEGEDIFVVPLNKPLTYKLPPSSFVWSQGSKIDSDTGCQVIRFRLGNPIQGPWLITVKGLIVIGGTYHIWIPKTGMILPQTILSPSDPFTTIYNTSSAVGLITVSCYDKKSQSPTPSSGRGFTRDNRVKPDFMVPGVDILGPLPNNRWGLMTGTSPASAITAGISSVVYEDQIIQKVEPSNTIGMKAILVESVKRDETVDYPSPSRGYGLLGGGSDNELL